MSTPPLFTAQLDIYSLPVYNKETGLKKPFFIGDLKKSRPRRRKRYRVNRIGNASGNLRGKSSEGFCVVRRKSNPRANSPCVNVEFLAAEDIRKGRAWPSPLLLFAVNYCAFQRQRQPTYPHRIIFCFPPKSCNGLNVEC